MADLVPIPATRLFGAAREVAECHFLNLACHAGNAIQDAAWEWWADVHWLNKALIVLGVLMVILAASRTFLWLLYKIGGWPAVAGAVIAILGIVLAALPKPRSAPEPAFGVDRVRPAPQRRPTIFDRWKWPKPGR